jgi:alpha-amylase
MWLTDYDTDAVLYKLIAKLNAIRKHAYNIDNDYVTTPTRSVFVGGSELAFIKGVEGMQVLILLSNQGSSARPYGLSLPLSYNAGTEVTEILNCKNYTLDNQGEFIIDMNAGEPRVFFPTEYMEGSGLCGYSNGNVSLAFLKNSRFKSLGVVGSGSPDLTAWAALLWTITTGLMIMF